MRVLVTGGTGFVGRHLCNLLSSRGFDVTAAVRSPPGDDFVHPVVVIGDISANPDFSAIPDGVDAVVHLAARVHVMHDRASDPLYEFRRVNVRGTRKLLQAAVRRGVKRFVYLSTIKVHGEMTGQEPFKVSDAVAPDDPYAISKLEAENLVSAMGADAGLETVIIRPPLVYGAGVGGNVLRLMRLVDSGYPIPLGAVRNSRSLVAVSNLCDLISVCLTNDAAPGRRFLVSDNSDVSVRQIIELMASAMSKPPRLLNVPIPLLRYVAGVVGRGAEISRLVDSLSVDTRDTRQTLDWTPPVRPEDEIRSTVDWFLEQKSRD
ncbi:MAG: NAD-dependent epimerase/dehydratase family protein [Woeseiaceae bacterium]|nr:NAD-dependent epimerase/dehydratase family protein [Woeseiaceae bacterium]